MALNISFKVNDGATSAVQNLQKQLSDGHTAALMSKISKEIAVKMQKKFRSNGGNWWAAAAKSVFKKNTNTTAAVGAKQAGVALHYYGGIVKPVRAKNLAIPLRPEFKGKNPRELTYKNMFIFTPRKAAGKRFLSYFDGGKIKAAYLLTPRAKINPHPEKFLRDEEITRSALDIVKIYSQKL
ncbi:MAG: hypothetical protein IKS15_02675 [Opitutales bacterium]|nr:hypothetical protein [Opitutales bacterium]